MDQVVIIVLIVVVAVIAGWVWWFENAPEMKKKRHGEIEDSTMAASGSPEETADKK